MRIAPSFWTPRTIATIPTLAHLRDQVLQRSTKRCPKWKFRLAPDIVAQLQPRACVWLTPAIARRYDYRQRTLEFDGRAYFGPNLTDQTFTTARPAGVPILLFTIYEEDESPDTWSVKFHRVSTVRRDPMTRALEPVNYIGNADRLVQRLHPDTFSGLPDVMLSPNCLICGKGLTDPASMARFIGPECAATSSLYVVDRLMGHLE